MIIDGFAGPGGWDEGLKMVGRTDVVGLEWDKAACATAKAAGHNRIRCDIAAYPTSAFAGQTITGVIMSPPCQAWSMAGKRKGELDRENCHHLADRMAAGDYSTDWTTWEDERSPLVCQPIRWVRDLSPEWVALEEVPAVAGLWEHFARILRTWGYNVWTGDLLAADYGVPQTRLRRILMAHKTRLVHPPMPTHAEHAYGVGLFGPDVKPWVSMAEALGWGFDDAPSATVSSGGAATGGAEPLANAGYRKRLAEYVMRTNQGNPRDGYYERAMEEPAPTLTSQLRSFSWQVRPGERPPVYVNGNQPNAGRRSIDEPAPTVVGSFKPDVIAGPGHHTTSRQNAPGSVRVTVQEAGVLQSFPADYPWQGSKSKQYEQVGNAVPPLLAAHVLAALGVGELGQEVAA